MTLFLLIIFPPDVLTVFQRKKKTITDVLSKSEPKPGCAADLQKALTLYFSDKKSVIEQEELKLPGESQPLPVFTSDVLTLPCDVRLHYGPLLLLRALLPVQ